MGLTDCFECGTPISGSADRCPKCGTTDTPLKRWKQKEWDQEKAKVKKAYGESEPFFRILGRFTLYFFLPIIGIFVSLVIIGEILWPLGFCISIALVPVVIIGLIHDAYFDSGIFKKT